MCRTYLVTLHLKHSLWSKCCKKIFRFVTVSQFSLLFNKITICSASFNVKIAFLPLTVFQEKHQMCRSYLVTLHFKHLLKSKCCKIIFTFVTVSQFLLLFNKIAMCNASFNAKIAFLPLTVF